MSVPKVAGIETEYGIMIEGAERSDPFLASRMLLSAYQQVGGAAVPCHSYFHITRPLDDNSGELPLIEVEDINIVEQPYAQAQRGQAQSPLRKYFGPHSVRAITNDETDLMLSNGSRFYIDHAHPEYSTPECLSPRLLVAADKAGERILATCQRWVNTNNILPPGQRIFVYKNNSDYKNNSYGCHENYLLGTELFDNLLYYKVHQVFRYLLPFFITRIILSGSGKVGSENSTASVGFQLSQRADFFETLIGLQTTHRRPLFNTRDEPHADSARFRRLHVILSDANMAEFSTYLKIGTTQLVLQMLEDGFIKMDLTLSNPVHAMQVVSRDLTFKQPLRLEDGRQMTAVDIQHLYLDLARKYLKQNGGSEEQHEVLKEWGVALSALPDNWEQLATRLDWAIKKRFLERYLTSKGAQWSEIAAWQPIIEEPNQLTIAKEMARRANLSWNEYEHQRELYFALRRLDLQYHDIRYDVEQDEVGLFYHLQQRKAIERLVTDEDIHRLIRLPPNDTRSWLRGQCIGRFTDDIIAADWSRLSFYSPKNLSPAGNQLELPDPLMGTEVEIAAAWPQLNTSLSVIAYCISFSKEAATGDKVDE